MIGIVDFGTYIPYYRLPRKVVGEAWRMEAAMSLLIGESVLAGYDEDVITMGVEAAEQALLPWQRTEIDALYLATTTAPFGEKSSAAVVAAAADLQAGRTVDVTGTLRAGSSALAVAFDTVRAGSARQALVVAADRRRPEPGTLLDAISGDGAAAFLVGSGEAVIAELVGEYHLSDPTIDTWRRMDDRYLRSDDEAYTTEVGYLALTGAAVRGLLDATKIDPATVNGVALYVPDGRLYMQMAQKLPFTAAFKRMGMNGPAPALLMQGGNLGAAFAPMQLALLLEQAQPGDHLVMIGYGDGADAYLFRVTEAIGRRAARRTTQDWLAAKGEIPSYTLAHYFRENWQDKPLFPAEVEPWTSLPLLQRERKELLSRYAQKCGQCGAVWYPRRPNCYECGAQDGFSSIRLSGRGTVASFVAEWAIPSPLPPMGMVTVDTAEGARLTTPSTDGDPRRLKIGDPVEFALRIFHTAKGLPHYSWKVRHIRQS
jgi:hydroxymethylglutaryl-CoA synthase